MKKHFTKIASVILAVAMMVSMFAVVSASAAEAGEAVGAATIKATSNFCTAETVTGNVGDTVSVLFKAPQDINVVDMQWYLDYQTANLSLTNMSTFAGKGMMFNTKSASHNVVGSCISIDNAYELSQGDTMFTVKFSVKAEGETTVKLTCVDMTNRTDAGDVIIINNEKASSEESTSLKVDAKSNFFAEGTATAADVSEFEDANGDVYVTVEYKLCAKNKYILGVDIDELTYDPAVLEWKEDYNKYNNTINIFPFAAENGFGSGTVQHQTKSGRIVANYSYVGKPAACADNEDGSAVTAVKAVFKVLNKNAGSTVVNCKVATVIMCDANAAAPSVQYLPIFDGTVNASAKALATYETGVSFGEAKNNIGDVDNSGTITIQDVTLLQRYIAEFEDARANKDLDMSVPANLKRCDTDLNGRIDVRDVCELQRYLADMKVAFK